MRLDDNSHYTSSPYSEHCLTPSIAGSQAHQSRKKDQVVQKRHTVGTEWPRVSSLEYLLYGRAWSGRLNMQGITAPTWFSISHSTKHCTPTSAVGRTTVMPIKQPSSCHHGLLIACVPIRLADAPLSLSRLSPALISHNVSRGAKREKGDIYFAINRMTTLMECGNGNPMRAPVTHRLAQRRHWSAVTRIRSMINSTPSIPATRGGTWVPSERY